MRNNNNNEKKRAIPIALLIIAIVAMLPVILSLIIAFFPVFLLALFGFLVFIIIKIIFFKRKKAKETTPDEEQQPQPISLQQPENEFSITQKAFSLLQRRITEQLALEYPGARWVWSTPNAMDRFKKSEKLIVLLNSAGGYNKAQVIVHNLIFKGMYYITLETEPESPKFPVDQTETESTEYDDDINDGNDITSEDPDGIIPEDMPVNYGRLAFEWCDANISDINAKYNEAIAQNNKEMLIPAGELSHPDSWPDICAELKRNGFSVADFCENGIKVNITD